MNIRFIQRIQKSNISTLTFNKQIHISSRFRYSLVLLKCTTLQIYEWVYLIRTNLSNLEFFSFAFSPRTHMDLNRNSQIFTWILHPNSNKNQELKQTFSKHFFLFYLVKCVRNISTLPPASVLNSTVFSFARDKNIFPVLSFDT